MKTISLKGPSSSVCSAETLHLDLVNALKLQAIQSTISSVSK